MTTDRMKRYYQEHPEKYQEHLQKVREYSKIHKQEILTRKKQEYQLKKQVLQSQRNTLQLIRIKVLRKSKLALKPLDQMNRDELYAEAKFLLLKRPSADNKDVLKRKIKAVFPDHI